MAPRRWYELEPSEGSQSPKDLVTVERWWAVCEECHQLLGAIASLEARVLNSGDRRTFKMLPELIIHAVLDPALKRATTRAPDLRHTAACRRGGVTGSARRRAGTPVILARGSRPNACLQR